jgi:hypothetical protein
VGAGWDISRIFMALAVPTLLAGLALVCKGLRYRAAGVDMRGVVVGAH